MKRLLLISTAAAILFPHVNVFAADDDYSIKIIHEDGSVDVIDLRSSQEQPVKQDAQPAEKVDAAPAPKTVEKAVEPVKKKAAAPAKAKPKKKVVKAPPARYEPVETFAKVVPPLPQRKPAFNPEAEAQDAEEVDAPVQEIQNVISRRQALSIAIQYAPPASQMNVFLTEYDGVPAYSALFKTENGYHEVVLDQVSGAVLNSRARNDILNFPKRAGYITPSLR